ncbi:MAG: hypothetical protein J7647_18045 [Cyanobacteria bacterium SBLK]|nr:hypothetical protein [Cyanobacteria bacterium SBLK]
MLKEFQDPTTGLQIHIHLVPPSAYLLQYQSQLLPGLTEFPQTVAIALFQAKEELVTESEAIAKEKDRLLEQFLSLARTLRETSNFPIEIICPRSGFPLVSQQGEKHFDIVTIVHQSLRIDFSQTRDRCKVFTYSDWKTAVYPGLFLASASIPEIAEQLDEIDWPKAKK